MPRLFLFWSVIFTLLACARAQGGGACESASDCNLNGLCTGGFCVCDAAWAGDRCTVLRLAQPAPGQGTCDPGLSGTAVGNTTTWGGIPIQDDAGLWHLHVAEMASHCGMCAWGSQSQVGHYVSPAMLGPYSRRDTAVGPFAHNPVVIEAPAGSASPRYLMFHIGHGCDTRGSHPCNYTALPACLNGTTPPGPPHHSPVPIATPANLTFCQMHVADSLDGPWLQQPAHWTVPWCTNNPAPLFLGNGSLMIACHTPFAGLPQCPDSSLTYFAVSATSDWMTGPYTTYCMNLTNPHFTFNGTTYTAANEDPHLYSDARGNLHIISHNQSPCYQNASFFGADVRGCGAHFFSADNGRSWTFQWEHAVYNGTIAYRSGGPLQRQYKRERPKLVQDRARTPIALATGISLALVDSFSPGDDSACTMVVGIDQ